MEGSVKFPCRENTFLQWGKISNVITCEERGGEEIEQRLEQQCAKAAKFRQELMTRSVNCGTRCFVPADKKLKVKNARQKVPRVGSWDAALTSAVQCTTFNNFQESRCASAVTCLNLAGISANCECCLANSKRTW